MRWSLFLVCLFAISNVRAQYVTIPDPNFVSWLQANGYSGCMTGALLDTTCPTVISATRIKCNGEGISNLYGIQYFDNLDTLECYNNLLTSLPSLPASLTRLSCNDNQLTSLPSLPTSLIFLSNLDNFLTSLPSLPASLTTLRVDNNNVSTLPPLPNGLSQLWCSYNNINQLPALPDSLKTLICFNNNLTVLPPLPDGLVWLHCSSNSLASLPALPDSLKTLECMSNGLNVLPPIPNSVTNLQCSFNNLITLPQLPQSLRKLWASNNDLTMIPALPDTLQYLAINNNPNLTCLPPFSVLTGTPNFNIANTGIDCLPNSIQHPDITSFPAVDTMAICGLLNANGCQVAWNILGTIHEDNNSNCVVDPVENKLGNIKVQLYQGTLEQQVYSNGVGHYSFDTDLTSYIMSVDTVDLPFVVSCPSNNTQMVTLTSIDSMDFDIDFGLECKPGYDIGVHSIVSSAGMFFPSQSATVTINAGDLAQYFGTSCNTNGLFGEITATFTGQAGVASISAPGGASGNTITWPVMDMSQWNYSVILGLESTAQSGDQICFTVTITANTGTDNNPSNNTLAHCFTVVNSYDPNFKEVYPTTPQPDSWYTYTVHFQNTGTAAAQHIVIKDTLDANLDRASFQRLGASHNDLTQVFQNGIVHFNFPNINLPDSNSNEPESHGWVQYRVKSKPTVNPLSTVIHNTASIYFDFNDPIVTNDALVEYSTSVATLPNIDFQLYPNPTANHVTIVLPKEHPNALVAVHDLTGREVFSTAPVNAQVQLQTLVLSSGVYHVAMRVNGKSIGGKKLVVVR